MLIKNVKNEYTYMYLWRILTSRVRPAESACSRQVDINCAVTSIFSRPLIQIHESRRIIHTDIINGHIDY